MMNVATLNTPQSVLRATLAIGEKSTADICGATHAAQRVVGARERLRRRIQARGSAVPEAVSEWYSTAYTDTSKVTEAFSEEMHRRVSDSPGVRS